MLHDACCQCNETMSHTNKEGSNTPAECDAHRLIGESVVKFRIVAKLLRVLDDVHRVGIPHGSRQGEASAMEMANVDL